MHIRWVWESSSIYFSYPYFYSKTTFVWSSSKSLNLPNLIWKKNKCHVYHKKQKIQTANQRRRFAPAIRQTTYFEYKINYIRTFRTALVPIKRHGKKYERWPLNTEWGEARKLSYICSDAVNVGREYFSISLESDFFYLAKDPSYKAWIVV